MSDPVVTEDTRKSSLKLGASGYEGVKVFTVIATSKVGAMVANGVPRRGYIYTDRDGSIPNTLCVCRDVSVNELKPARVGQAGLYEVTANYGQPSGGGDTNEPVPGGPAIPSWSGYMVSKPVDLAYATDQPGSPRTVPMVDRVGRPFDPPWQDEFPRLRLDLQWVAQSFSALQFYLLGGSINHKPFYGVTRGYGKLLPFTTSVREDGLTVVTMGMEVNPESWYIHLLDLLPPPAGLQFNPRFADWSVIPVP